MALTAYETKSKNNEMIFFGFVDEMDYLCTEINTYN